MFPEFFGTRVPVLTSLWLAMEDWVGHTGVGVFPSPMEKGVLQSGR